jgi:hypothetical protein
MKHARPWIIVCTLALLLGLLAGCARFAGLRLQPELREADRAFERGDYALAATTY